MEGNTRGSHIQRVEENEGKLRGIQGDNCITVNKPPHGEISRDNNDTYPGGECRWRRYGYVYGVLTMRIKSCGVPSGRVSGKGKQPGKT